MLSTEAPRPPPSTSSGSHGSASSSLDRTDVKETDTDPFFNPDLWTVDYLSRISDALENQFHITLSSTKPEDRAALTSLNRLIYYAKMPEKLDKLMFKPNFWPTLPAVALKQFITKKGCKNKAVVIQALTDYIAVGNLSLLLMGKEKDLSQDKVAQLAAKILAFSLTRLLDNGATMLPLGWCYTDRSTSEKVGHYCIAVLQKMPPLEGQKEDLYKINICEGVKCSWFNPEKFGELWKQTPFLTSESMTIEEVKDSLRDSFSYLFEQLRPSYDLNEVQKAIYDGMYLPKKQTWIVVPDRHACTVESLRAALYALRSTGIKTLFDSFREDRLPKEA